MESRSQWEYRRQWWRTHQWLVDEAEHVGVVEEDVHWSLGMKTDVCDGSVPLEPKMMKPLLLDSPAPFCVLFVWDAVLKYLRKDITQRKYRLVPRKPEGHPWLEKQLYKPCLYHSQNTHFPYFFFFWLHHTACGILVPHLGIKPTTPVVEAQSFNHWTTKEVSTAVF